MARSRRRSRSRNASSNFDFAAMNPEMFSFIHPRHTLCPGVVSADSGRPIFAEARQIAKMRRSRGGRQSRRDQNRTSNCRDGFGWDAVSSRDTMRQVLFVRSLCELDGVGWRFPPARYLERSAIYRFFLGIYDQ